MPKKKSGNTNTREWEKKRRERLNACFAELGKLLPGHDPASSESKIKILESACKYIQILQKENQELVDGSENTAEIKLTYVNSLRRRVKTLLSRVCQLAGLLRAAGITVPEAQDNGGADETFEEDMTGTSDQTNLLPALGPRPMRWSNKIKPQEAALLLEKVQALKRTKKNKKTDIKKAPKKLNNTSKHLGISNKSVNEVTRRKAKRSSKSKEKILTDLQNHVDDKSRARYILVNKKELHKCIVVPTATPTPLPPVSTANNISLLGTSTTLLVTPSPSITTVNSSLSLIMPPRPLILTNASLLPAVIQPAPARFIQVGAPPVLPPPPPPQLPPPPPQPPPVISTFSTNSFPLTTQTLNRPNFPILAPKLVDVTRTTIANKKPISALKATARTKIKLKNSSNTHTKTKSIQYVKIEKQEKDDANHSSTPTTIMIKKKSKDKEQTEPGNKKQKLDKDKESTKENDKSKNYTIDAICKSKETNKQTKEPTNDNKKIYKVMENDNNNLRTVDNNTFLANIKTSDSVNILNSNTSFDNNSSLFTPFQITNQKINCPQSTNNCNETLPNIQLNEDFSCTPKSENTSVTTANVNISSNVLNNVINNSTSTNPTLTNTSNDIILNITNDNNKSDTLNKAKKSDSNNPLELENNKKTSLDNTFTPITTNDHLDAQSLLQSSDYAGDLFASLNVPTGSHHPELISPTAAFLLAFPLVSTSKNTENDVSEEPCPDGTSALLQISNLDNNSIINCVARDHMEVPKESMSLETNNDKEQDQTKIKWIGNSPTKNIPEKLSSSDPNNIEKRQEYEKQTETNIAFPKNLQSYPKDNSVSNNYPKEQQPQFDKHFGKEINNTQYNKNPDTFSKQHIFTSNVYNKTQDNFQKQTNDYNKAQEIYNKTDTNSRTSYIKTQNNFTKSQINFTKLPIMESKNSFINLPMNEPSNSFSKEPTENVYESQKSLFVKTQINFNKHQKQPQQQQSQESSHFQMDQNNFNKVETNQVDYNKSLVHSHHHLPQQQHQDQQIIFPPKDPIIPHYNNNNTNTISLNNNDQQFHKEHSFNLDLNFSKDINILPSTSSTNQLQFKKNPQHLYQQKEQHNNLFSDKDQNNIFQEKDQQLFSLKDQSDLFQQHKEPQLFHHHQSKDDHHMFNFKEHIFPQKEQSILQTQKDTHIFQQKDHQKQQSQQQQHIFQQKDQELFAKDLLFQHKDSNPLTKETNIFQQNKDQNIFNKDQQFPSKNIQDPFFMPEIRTNNNKEDTLFAPHQFPTQASNLLPQTQSQQSNQQQNNHFQTSHSTTLPDITNAQFENFKLSKNQQNFDFALDKRIQNQNFDILNSKQTDFTNITINNKNINQEFQNNKEVSNKDKTHTVSNSTQLKMYNNYLPTTTYSYMFNDFTTYSSNYTQANSAQNNSKTISSTTATTTTTTTTSSNFMSWNPVTNVSQTQSTNTFDNFTMKTNLLPDTLDLNLDFVSIDKNRKLPDLFPSTYTNEDLRTDFREELQTNLPTSSTLRTDKETNNFNQTSINNMNTNNSVNTNISNNSNNSNNKSNQRPPVNWMTAPDLRSTLTTEDNTPKDLDFSNNFNNNFFNNQNLVNDQDFTLWPSRKMLGADLSNALFTPSTLPTLVGDLALGTNFSMNLDESGKSFTNTFETDNNKEDSNKTVKQDKSKSNNKTNNTTNNNKQQTECQPFLSVSQLVDPKAKNQKKRQQGNKQHSTTKNLTKRQETQLPTAAAPTVAVTPSSSSSSRKDNQFDEFHCRTNNTQWQDKRFQRNNSYSAEALIGVSSDMEQTTKVTNIPPPMVTEKFAQSYSAPQPPPPRNTLPTFPSTTSDSSTFNFLSNITDIQTNDLSTTYNNNTSTFNYVPSSGPTTAPVYSTNTMAPFLPDNNDTSFIFSQTHQQQSQSQNLATQVQQIPPPVTTHSTRGGGGCSGTSKNRNRRKQPEVSVHNTSTSSVTTPAVSGISGLVDLGYLTLPHTIQSPLMDENTSLLNHSSGLLPPTQPTTSLYQSSTQPNASVCVAKNHLQMQPTALPQPGLSTTSSLTNFNLSAIFPEINDKVPSYGPNKIGTQNHNQRQQQGSTNLPPLNGIWPT